MSATVRRLHRGHLVLHATPTLTEREVTIVGLIANGRSNKSIGKSLAIELGTVKAHVTTIKRKLGARNRAHVAGLGVQDLGIHVVPVGMSDEERP